jgi:hypothetical protein
MITEAEVYKSWIRSKFKAAGKIPSASVLDISKCKNKSNVSLFKSVAEILNSPAYSNIDVNMFMRVAVDRHGGWDAMPYVIGPTCFKTAYNEYLQYVEASRVTASTSEDDTKDQLMSSAKLVIKYCIENKLWSFPAYMEAGINTIPVFLRHFNTGLLHAYIVVGYEGTKPMLRRMPQPLLAEYGANLIRNWDKYRGVLVNSPHMNLVRKLIGTIDEVLYTAKENHDKNLPPG